MLIVIQSEAKDLEYIKVNDYVDVHEIFRTESSTTRLHYTTFRSEWQIKTIIVIQSGAKDLEYIKVNDYVDVHEILHYTTFRSEWQKNKKNND